MFSLKSEGGKRRSAECEGEVCIEQTQAELCSKPVPGSGNLGGRHSIPAMARQPISKCLCARLTCGVCLSPLDYYCLQRGSGRANRARVVQISSPPADPAQQ